MWRDVAVASQLMRGLASSHIGSGGIAPSDRAIGEPLWEPRRNKHHTPVNPACFGGQGGIRTHGEHKPTAVFKTAALNHSATCPSPRFLANPTALPSVKWREGGLILPMSSSANKGIHVAPSLCNKRA